MNASHFHHYRVDKIVDESEIIKSFYLVAEGGEELPQFLPGQFLTFKFNLPELEQPVIRNYSLSCRSDHPEYYRISVKRESSPPGHEDMPDGLVSNYLHSVIKLGDILVASHPDGQFHLDTQSTRPVVLLSAGVGVTPIISMLHKLAQQSSRRVIYIHACENQRVQAFRNEAETLAQKSSNVQLHHCYREYQGQDDNVSLGLVDKRLLQNLLSLDDYEFYLCGPPEFMLATYRIIRQLGVASERIAYEFFGPATVLEKEFYAAEAVEDSLVPQARQVLPDGSIASNESIVQIYFKNSGLSAHWNDGSESILEFAEANGLEPDFSCRAGICNTCLCAMPEGEVEYIDDPLEMPAEGYVLPCISKPKTNIVIEL